MRALLPLAALAAAAAADDCIIHGEACAEPDVVVSPAQRCVRLFDPEGEVCDGDGAGNGPKYYCSYQCGAAKCARCKSPGPAPPGPPAPPPQPVPPAPAGGNGIFIQPIPSALSKFTRWFTQYVNVFGVNILASKKVEESHLLHAANVMAQYLDGNADSKVDDLKVGDALVKAGATLIMFGSADNINMREFELLGPQDGFNFQDLENDEIVPDRKDLVKNTEHDATVEEVYHLLTCNGWANVYPDVFECTKKSDIGKTMIQTVDNCGYAFNHTHKKKCDGRFHYDDATCDFGCLIVEYTYWSMTTILGYQNGPPLGPKNRCKDISDEWEMCTKDALEKYDKGAYDILTNPAYHMATVLPDGAYKGTMPPMPPSTPSRPIHNACTDGDDFAAVRRRTAARRLRRAQRLQR